MKKLLYGVFIVAMVAFVGTAWADGLKLTGWSYEVDTVNENQIFLYSQGFAKWDGDQVRSHRRVGSENAGQGIFLVPAGVYLQNISFFRGIVLVKPVTDHEVWKSIHPQKGVSISFLDFNPYIFIIFIVYNADGINIVYRFHG